MLAQYLREIFIYRCFLDRFDATLLKFQVYKQFSKPKNFFPIKFLTWGYFCEIILLNLHEIYILISK